MARGVGLQSKHIPVTVGRLTEKYKNNKIQKEENMEIEKLKTGTFTEQELVNLFGSELK